MSDLLDRLFRRQNASDAKPERELRYSDVFVAGGHPRHTYNPRLNLKLEATLSQVLDNLCQLVTVTGSTKSGKTVLVERILPRDRALWIDGGTCGNEDAFWDVVIQQQNLFNTVTVETSKESTSETSGKLVGDVDAIIASAGAEVASSIGESSSSTSSSARTISSKVTAITGLSKHPIPVVIDDFHYLPKPVQGDVIRALKALIARGLPVVIIAIPHHRYDAIKVEREMTGRIMPVTIPSWTPEELMFIPDTGFPLLISKIDEELSKKLVAESLGSPHLMQAFCRHICRVKGIITPANGAQIILKPEELDEIFRDIADTIGRPIFEKLARGPRQRADRIPRKLKTGKTVDIYGLVLLALAHIKPGIIKIEYEQLRLAIKEIIDDQSPQLHEVARVLKHMSEIAATDRSSTPVIEFDEEEKLLHITDPFFAFYLRWGRFNDYDGG